MATPHVTGVAALLKSQYTNIGDGQMKSIILDSVDKKSTPSGKVLIGGRLNVVKAIR
jgi:subtilisin family serine protease